MLWESKAVPDHNMNEWRKRFAIFPVRVEQTTTGFIWVWLEVYEVRGSRNALYIDRRLPGASKYMRHEFASDAVSEL